MKQEYKLHEKVLFKHLRYVTIKKKCLICNGTGQLKTLTNKKIDCPECRGVGYMSDGERRNVWTKGIIYAIRKTTRTKEYEEDYSHCPIEYFVGNEWYDSKNVKKLYEKVKKKYGGRGVKACI